MSTRRAFVAGAATLALRAAAAPVRTVAIQRCRTYRAGLEPTMRRLFDAIGGMGRLVNNKTVAIKVNLTGRPLAGLPGTGWAHWTDPRVVAMTVHLMNEAGARRIRILESPWSSTAPLDEYMKASHWDPALIMRAGRNVEFENTNGLGSGAKFVRFPVPGGGLLYPAYDLNHSYADCDVFVSIAKLKEHAAGGVSLSMKNCFGLTPAAVYGDVTDGDDSRYAPFGVRKMVLHDGSRPPSLDAPGELDRTSPRDPGFRIPRVVADLCAARPVDLSIIDGVESLAGGEGPWIPGTRPFRPAVLIAGMNPVCTDAVAMAVLGFDPMAARGAPPFEACDNTLALAEQLGTGSRDLGRIEVAGAQIADIQYNIRKN